MAATLTLETSVREHIVAASCLRQYNSVCSRAAILVCRTGLSCTASTDSLESTAQLDPDLDVQLGEH
jgi:hypothetical protein